MHASLRATTALLGLALASGLGLAAATQQPARAAITDIVINEVESNGDPAGDWVELTNKGTARVDISGMIIRDDKDSSTVTIPAGTSLAPGGFHVVYTGDVGLGGADMARLFATDATTLIDSYSWTTHAATSYGRCPNAAGEFTTTASTTPGAANACTVAKGVVVINEIESQAGSPDDWVELKNIGDAPIDVSGYVLSDNSDDHRYTLPAGSVIAPGAYLTIGIATVPGGFGLGGADAVRLFNGLELVDSKSWESHSPTSIGRCADGIGGFTDTAAPTKNAANDCPLPKVLINEIKSTGDGADAIELFNSGSTDVDLSGYVLKDDNDTRNLPLPAGTVIKAGGYLVFEEGNGFSFGLGNGDAARLFTPDGRLVDGHTYAAHGVPGRSRCGDQFVEALLTLGAANDCGATTPSPTPSTPADNGATPWPGSQNPTPVDVPNQEDSSGLDYQPTGTNTGILWGIDNGTGTLWKWDVNANTTTVAPGWETGKRVRFIRDAQNPAAAGPDSEGVTVGPGGMLYVAAERDNADKGVNQNTILMVDPNKPGPDIVADKEWNLTSLLPSVTANTGIEAVEFVPDSELTGKLYSTVKEGAYNPSDYPGHGAGLFFVALEDNGHVYGFALNEDGTATLVTEIVPGLGGVMALDYDSETGVLWALCDDGCENTGAQITFALPADGADVSNGGVQVQLVSRPSELPVKNFEGFAVATNTCVAGQRAVWWFEDGIASGAMRQGTLPCGGQSPTETTPAPSTPVPTETTPEATTPVPTEDDSDDDSSDDDSDDDGARPLPNTGD